MRANTAARGYMGKVAWPTVILAITVLGSYIATLITAISGQLPIFPAFLLAAFLTYMVYTVLHDAVHGSINGKNKSLCWLNDGLGYLAGQMMFISFKAHQKEHLAHHRNTNVKGADPDLVLEDDNLFSLLKGTLLILPMQYKYYLANHWKAAPSRDKLIFATEIIVMVGWRLALVLAGYWWIALSLTLLSVGVGVFALLILFVWLVHRSFHETKRYKNTNTLIMPGWLDGPITWLWLYQNYHSVHHLFPRVPFYHYKALFKKIEDVMIANDAPIIRLGKSSI